MRIFGMATIAEAVVMTMSDVKQEKVRCECFCDGYVGKEKREETTDVSDLAI